MQESSSFQATMNLREQLPGGLTLEALEAATAEEIDACICKVGFHNTKCDSLLPEVFWFSTAGQTDGRSLFFPNQSEEPETACSSTAGAPRRRCSKRSS